VDHVQQALPLLAVVEVADSTVPSTSNRLWFRGCPPGTSSVTRPRPSTPIGTLKEDPVPTEVVHHQATHQGACGCRKLCHQAIFVNHASGAVAAKDAEVVQVGDAIR
jgi:hypothetical protein